MVNNNISTQIYFLHRYFTTNSEIALSVFQLQGSFMRSNKELPCQNCLFIEMGEMACYQETCPDCGRVPPSRSREIKKYRENLEVLQGEVILNRFF